MKKQQIQKVTKKTPTKTKTKHQTNQTKNTKENEKKITSLPDRFAESASLVSISSKK